VLRVVTEPLLLGAGSIAGGSVDPLGGGGDDVASDGLRRAFPLSEREDDASM